MSKKRKPEHDLPPWEESPCNNFDNTISQAWPKQLTRSWNRVTVREQRAYAARAQARGFLGSRGCRTNRIRNDRQLNDLPSICFGVSVDRCAKPKTELVRAARAIADMGRKTRELKMRAAQESGHPATKFWSCSR
jgi:hypothetical protein